MAKKLPDRRAGRSADQYMVRFPDGMRENLAKLAEANGRSMNAEILAALEKHLEGEDRISKLETSLNELWQKFEAHREAVFGAADMRTPAGRAHAVLYGSPTDVKKRR